MKEAPTSEIKKYIVSEIEKYEDKQCAANEYIENYVDLLREIECKIEDLKKYKEDTLKFENKNQI